MAFHNGRKICKTNGANQENEIPQNSAHTINTNVKQPSQVFWSRNKTSLVGWPQRSMTKRLECRPAKFGNLETMICVCVEKNTNIVERKYLKNRSRNELNLMTGTMAWKKRKNILYIIYCLYWKKRREKTSPIVWLTWNFSNIAGP